MRRPAVYLAGPGVFRPDATEHASRLRAACEAAGLAGRFPGDNSAEAEPAPAEILRDNLALIDACDAVLADASPFRGPSLDAGTAMEIGYAVARGKPVFCYGVGRATYLDRVRASDPGASAGPIDGRWSDGDGWSVEDFGLYDNLMIACSAAGAHATVEAAAADCASRLGARDAG